MRELKIYNPNNLQLTEDVAFKRKSAEESMKKSDENKIAKSTQRRYASVIGLYEEFCNQLKINPAPEDDEQAALNVKAFMSHSITNKKIKHVTIKVYFGALSFYFTNLGYKTLPTKSPILKGLVQSAKRQNPYTERKVKALVKDDIVAMISACDQTKTIGIRDAAIIAIKFCSGCRDDEIASLDMNYIKDRHANGYIMKLPETKTGQQIKNVIGGKDIPLLEFMDNWIKTANITEGLIFHEVKKNGKIYFNSKEKPFKTRTIRGIIKKYAAKAGLDASLIAGHSTRRGIATYLLREGVSIKSVQGLLGHVTPGMTLRYEEEKDLIDNPAAKGLL